MAMGSGVQRSRLILPVVFLLVFVLLLWDYRGVLLGPSGSDPTHESIRESAYFVVVLWPMAAAALLRCRTRRSRLFSNVGKAARWLYTLACLLCIFHVAIAYHVGHGWSHRAAFEHTQRISGFGPGIYVNYLFVAIWVADAMWAWIALDNYLSRPAWVNWLVIGFMGFIVLNAAIIFGKMGWIGWFFLVSPWILLWWERRCGI
jgi:hypothetical protein